MKQHEHLPMLDIGPVYVVSIVVPTLAAVMYGNDYVEYCRKVNRCWPWIPEEIKKNRKERS